VDRPKSTLEKDIAQYHVYTRDDLVVACGQLIVFEGDYAEIACMMVSPAYRARGRGDAMLGYLERQCVQRGASILFVLSTQTMEWFVERGFDEVEVEMLPPSRQATYNSVRASKIYMKKITSVRDLDASELFWDR
jgi:amino-acid N-acetyltransferase